MEQSKKVTSHCSVVEMRANLNIPLNGIDYILNMVQETPDDK